MQAPLSEVEGAVGKLFGVLFCMADNQGVPLADIGQTPDQRAHILSGFFIQRSEGFVEQ